MLLKNSPFELDKESMIIRNNKLLKHYDQLNLIKKRKNLFLPKIVSPLQSKMFSPKQININNNVFKNIFQSRIDRENEKMNNKIIEISNRPMKKVKEDEQFFFNLIKLNKKSRNKIRQQNMDLIVKSNIEIRKRISNVHPVINHNELNQQYLKSRKVYKLKKKIEALF